MLNPSWDDLTDELEHIRSRAPLHAKWLAYEGSEAYGIWQLSPDLPEEDERRARFSLFAAHVIAKCGVLPVPVPKPLEHCPHWRSVCEAGSKRTAPRGVPRLLAELEHQKSRSHEGYRYPHITLTWVRGKPAPEDASTRRFGDKRSRWMTGRWAFVPFVGHVSRLRNALK